MAYDGCYPLAGGGAGHFRGKAVHRQVACRRMVSAISEGATANLSLNANNHSRERIFGDTRLSIY
jgi:hypothetical protein